MAASAVALLPSMRILATVHLYCRFRAYDRTNSATRAFIAIVGDSGQITAAVHFRREGNLLFGTKRDTDLTTFAEFAGNSYFSFHRRYPEPIIFIFET